MLSFDERAEGKAFRAGDGGSVGTEVVVVIVVMAPAFCFESFTVCSACFSRFALFWFEARCADAPKPVRDIAVDSEPCYTLLETDGNACGMVSPST